MNGHCNGLYPGCCRSCPKLQGFSVATMAVADLSPSQPEEGKVALAPPTGNKSPELDAFLVQNPKQGFLRIQAFRGQQVLPVSDVMVKVSRVLDEHEYVFYQGATDASGVIRGITLPAAPKDRSLDPGEPLPMASYDLFATHPGFQSLQTTVDIYQDIQTTQMIQLRLKLGG